MKFIETNNIKGDIFGGVTAGIVALPLALAFGIQAFGGIDDPSAASLGALAGIVGATMLGFFAALFGGTHSQISGPTGPMTVVAATLISGAWAASGGNVTSVLISMSLAGLFCGLFQILFGIIKLGKYIRYIPYPVLSGFMSGIGFSSEAAALAFSAASASSSSWIYSNSAAFTCLLFSGFSYINCQKNIQMKPRAPMMIKAISHPSFTARGGIIRGAARAPTDAPALKIEVAKALSFFGKYSAVILTAAGKFPDSPRARMPRQRRNR